MDWGKLLVVLFAIGAVAYCSHATSDPEPVAGAASSPPPAKALPGCPGLRADLLKTATKVSKIGDVLCEVDGDGYALTVIYVEPPASIAQVKSLSNATAGMALDYLKANGAQPFHDKVFLSVWSRKAERGATGQQVWRVYGSTIYNYNTDQLEFTEQR